MESTLNIAVVELEELAKSINDLYNQKYYEASALYCRNFYTILISAITEKEGILLEPGLFELIDYGVDILIEQSKNTFIHKIDDKVKIALNNAFSFDYRKLKKTDLENVSLLLNWFKNYAEDKLNKENYLKEDTELPKYTYRIDSIEIRDYQCIEKLILRHLPLDAQFVVFTGENGYGKTSILQALAIGLYGGIDEQSNEILLPNEQSAIALTIRQNGHTINQAITYKKLKSNITIPNIVAYGASRLQLEAPESMYEYKKKRSPIYSLFHTEGVLQNIEYWLLNEANDIQQQFVKDLLLKLLPHIDDIKINKSPLPISYYENKHIVDSSQLSAGHKNILGMVGDMLIRLYRQQPNVMSPSDLTGIVLIDEIEAHLHPKWQREFPKLLSTIFPKIQFIVTTHSVITFLGMPKNSVFFNVSRSENGGTEVKRVDIDIANFLPHQILTSPIFGMENVLSVENTDFGKIRTENTYDEVVEHDKIRTELKSLSQNFKFPQHLKVL